MGLIVGKIGIGAALDGPLVQVDLFPGCGRVLATGISVAACTGDGRGAMVSFPAACVCVRPAVLSDRPIKDFLNHDDFDEVGVMSVRSFEPR